MSEKEKDLGLFDREALLMKLPPDAKEIPREQVERVARIVGEQSQAIQALARADRHGGPVRFWYSNSQDMLWLELVEDMKH